MEIKENSGIEGLHSVLEIFFNVALNKLDSKLISEKLPQSLCEIYLIDTFFAKHDSGFETVRFFENMDRLTKYENLKLEEDSFAFLTENQGNWYCKTTRNGNEITIENHDVIPNGSVLKTNLDTLLTTFALQELSYNVKYLIGLNYDSLDEFVFKLNKIEPLWINKIYINRPVSYYIIDDEILLDDSMMTLASNNKEKIEFYKSILDFYDFD